MVRMRIEELDLAAAQWRPWEPPTWLVQSVPVTPAHWGAFGLELVSWKDCLRALWREWATR